MVVKVGEDNYSFPETGVLAAHLRYAQILGRRLGKARAKLCFSLGLLEIRYGREPPIPRAVALRTVSKSKSYPPES